MNPLGTRSGTVCYATGTAQTRARLLIPERARLGSAASGQSPPPTGTFFQVEEFTCGELEHTHN